MRLTVHPAAGSRCSYCPLLRLPPSDAPPPLAAGLTPRVVIFRPVALTQTAHRSATSIYSGQPPCNRAPPSAFLLSPTNTCCSLFRRAPARTPLDRTLDMSNKKEIWRLASILFLGQLVSFSLAVSSFIASYMASIGIDTPLTQSFFTYLTLSLVLGSIFLYRRCKLLVPWYLYLALGFVDVQGNYLSVKAYQYSSITSVTLLDCWIIPWVMILTWFVVQTRYSLWQFVGAAICVGGLALVLLSDHKASSDDGMKPLLGDALVIGSTFFFAMSSVGEEFFVKRRNLFEVLTMLGVFGAMVTACEISIFERKNLESVQWSLTVISLYIGYAAAGFLFYILVPFILKMSGSALFNLSLLTSDMWAIVIRIFIYNQQVNWLYYLAFSFAAIGLIMYSLNEKGSATATTIEDEEATHLHEPLILENAAAAVGDGAAVVANLPAAATDRMIKKPRLPQMLCVAVAMQFEIIAIVYFSVHMRPLPVENVLIDDNRKAKEQKVFSNLRSI
ncbi:hypothetical protein J5N97_022662 [Dioscorea zingiberensis]|uniref:Solute carrier family 35 member F1 n=1 Tax=Dioscorea zingiberensis TaxID=325984 RepID=A0A9D5CBM6_9LILI|nr:hypothetical protein J5N97_022662 [Dioscorea zingiberensis]